MASRRNESRIPLTTCGQGGELSRSHAARLPVAQFACGGARGQGAAMGDTRGPKCLVFAMTIVPDNS